MTAHDLLADLTARGVQLTAQGGRLHVDAPAGVLTEELRAALVSRKADLLALLARSNEINEINEPGTDQETPTSLNSSNSYDVGETMAATTAAAIARWRAGLGRRLQHWEDDRLLALVAWHLMVAFDRGGERTFRRHLPRSLAQLTDEDLAAIVDWPSLATLEQALWQSDPEMAARINRGAQKLAAWWNKQRRSQPSGSNNVSRGHAPG